MPTSFLQGFMSGFVHPAMGLDHLSFILLLGLISLSLLKRSIDPLLFIVSSLIACTLRVNYGGLPWTEAALALLLPLILTLLWLHPRLSRFMPLLMVGGGLLHGYSYGEALDGIEMVPLLAYLLGLAVIQITLSYGFGKLCSGLAAKNRSAFEAVENITSAVASGTALYFIVQIFR